ncbi:hypothetical protein T484DRAFT_1947328 [Baffinella frigidus]|nr:hypothetical protein T484DRAFT_1947328 [Cryptophyta sp. CCMP2293]
MHTSFGQGLANYPAFASFLAPGVPPGQTSRRLEQGVHVLRNKVFTCYVKNTEDSDGNAAPVRQVNVNKEELLALFHLPLTVACREVGMCSTTFKKACRALGVVKWPYNRPQRKASAKGASDQDETRLISTVLESLDMSVERGVSETAHFADMPKATTPRLNPFSFPQQDDFAETARPDPFSFSKEMLNTTSDRASPSHSAGSDDYGKQFWSQPASANHLPSQWEQHLLSAQPTASSSTHYMPPAPHDDVPSDLMELAPRRITAHHTSVACWTPSAPSRDSLWTMSTAPAHDAGIVSWATWGPMHAHPPAPAAAGTSEGSMIDAVEACLSLPLDGDFVLDFCKQESTPSQVPQDI